jgi:RES domain-containing protein
MLYRIGSLKHPIFSSFGAALNGARWNSKGVNVIYAATSLAAARLELLAHIGFDGLPKDYGYVEIDLPPNLAKTRFGRSRVPSYSDSVAWGDAWIASMATAVAVVPSKASPGDVNVLINPAHPDFYLIKASKARRAVWDARHFRQQKRRK